jgi:glycosyltransferase involved in cell wall biosynthesis
MRILFLSDNFPPEVNAPATRTYEHCRHWVNLGAEVTVITCFPNFPKGKVYAGYKNRCKRTEWIDGIKVVRVWSYISANEGFFKRTIDYISFSVSSFIAGLFEPGDIIVATSPQFFTALGGRVLSFWKRKPWIMEVRDLWPESIKTVGAMKDNAFIRYFEWQEKRCYRSAKKIICVTDSFKKAITEKGIDPRKIGVIKNGANLSLFKSQEKDDGILRKYNLENKTVLGYIGTHGMAHNLSFILDCAKRLADHKEIHFLFIGDGAEKENLKRKVLEDRIDNVTMLDSVSKNEIKDYISVLDIALINLKKSDLFKTVIPSKIFENAAMRIPILMGVEGEAKSIVDKYDAGLCYKPEDQESFLKELHFMLVPENYQIYKEGCAKLALAFDRKKLAKEMYEILSQV